MLTCQSTRNKRKLNLTILEPVNTTTNAGRLKWLKSYDTSSIEPSCDALCQPKEMAGNREPRYLN
jgi:hypothetical protein